MANHDEVEQQLRDLLSAAIQEKVGSSQQPQVKASVVLHLSEAYAWVREPDQPHGQRR